jgi:hypothetical protein
MKSYDPVAWANYVHGRSREDRNAAIDQASRLIVKWALATPDTNELIHAMNLRNWILTQRAA